VVTVLLENDNPEAFSIIAQTLDYVFNIRYLLISEN
jgi:hypothetical protein